MRSHAAMKGVSVGAHTLGAMAELKPAYLIHGDDHGAVAERRAGLKALAEQQGDAASVEVLDGEAGTPAGVALALSAMTFAIGRRVIVVDGVERWKQAEVEQHLMPAMAEMPPDTTVALFAREEDRSKAPAAVHDAVKRAGGQIVAQATVKPWELGKWARAQAERHGDLRSTPPPRTRSSPRSEDASSGCCSELEKLALEVEVEGETQRVSVEDIERRAAHSAEYRSFALADALVGGDTAQATLAYLRVRRQGERLAGLTYLMAQRVREALADRAAVAGGRVGGGCAPRPADAPARGRALRRGRRPAPTPSVCARRSARSPTWSSTRAAARRSARPDRHMRRSTRTRSRCARSRRSPPEARTN